MEEQSNISAATGNNRSSSPYLQAFPAEADFMDGFTLVRQPQELSAWLVTIMQGAEATLSAELNHKTWHKVWYLYRETQNQLIDRGESFLRLGFPVLGIRQDNQLLSVPVFLWPVDLKPDPYRSQTWQFRIGSGVRPFLNPYVKPLLSKYFADAEWEDALVGDVSVLLDLLQEAGELSTDLRPFPETLPPGQSQVLWSPLLGIFPPRVLMREGQADLSFLQDKTNQKREGKVLSHIPLTPWQQAGFTCTQKHAASVISGGPATGKTHLLEHLVVHALGSGERVLLISERTDVHDRLLQRLDVLHLRHLAFSVREWRSDGDLLRQLLAAVVAREGGNIRFDRPRFEQKYTEYARQFSRFQQHLHAVRNPVFGALNWTQTVGGFLASNRIIGRELLANQLDTDSFSRSPEEFDRLNQMVTQAQPLYEAIGRLNHPLGRIAPRIYLALDKEEARNYLNEQLDRYITRFSRLQHEYILSLNHYTDRLHQIYIDYARRMQERLTDLLQAIEDGQTQYGDDFLLSSNTSIRLYKLVSARVKDIQALRENIRQKTRQLRAAHELDNLFDYSFPEDMDDRNMQTVQSELQHYAEALKAWENTIPALVAPYRKRISPTNHHPRLNWSAEATNLMEKLEQALEEINTAGLLKEPRTHQALTLEKQQEFIEQLLSELHELSLSMRDFPAGFDWYRFWLHLDPTQQTLLATIIRVKPADWGAAFSSWYLDQVLSNAYSPDLPGQTFVQRIELAKLREDYRSFIAYRWAVHQNDYSQTLKRRHRETYNELISGNRSSAGTQTLAQVFEHYDRHVTQYLPLIVANSLQASRTFANHSSSPFDLIIFEGAQYTHERNAEELLPLAKRSVFIGDDHYIHGDDRADVLEAVQAIGLPGVRLQGGINPALAMIMHPSLTVEVRQIDGRYEPGDQINEAESAALLQGLNAIPKTASRTFPKVGIVAFTRPQRDLLAYQLRRLKKTNDEAERLISQLERNGLRILALDELSGHRFHTIFCSLTYGITNLEGQLPEAMAVLNTLEGKRQLYELSSCVTHVAHIVNSIPLASLRKLAEASAGSGYRALLTFMEQQPVTNDFVENEADDGTEQIFLREVALRLEHYLGRERILRTFDTKGWGRGLVIAPARPGHMHYLLVPDGLLAKADASNPEWEYEQQENLRSNGLEPIPVWSLRWWRNAEEEARRLASYIFNLDKEVYGTS